MDKVSSKPDAIHTGRSKQAPTDTAAIGTYGGVLRLQQTIGNQAMLGLLNRKEAPPSGIRITQGSGASDISREDDPETTARRHHERGRRLFEAGRYDEAIVHFERARQVPTLEPDVYVAIIRNLATSNLRLERYATAIHYLELYLAADISDEEREAAEQALEQARAGTGADAERILERENADIPDATGDTTADTARAQALFDQARRLFDEGQFRQAIILFEQVREMENQPEEVRSTMLFNIARCNMRLGRAATAISYLEQYLLAPGADRAEVIRLLTEAQEAAGTLTSEQNMQMIFRLAREAHNAGQYEDAEALFRMVLDHPVAEGDVVVDMHYNLALTLVRLERYEEALNHFREYAAQYPDDENVQAHIAECERLILEAE